MRILYVAMRQDYGDPNRGLSFEHWNFHESLAADGHELIPFDFMALHDELGRERMNRRLFELARAETPDLMFTVLFKDELDPRVVRRISDELPLTTLNWFCDDHWRFESFSSRWAPCFNWVVTTASSALPKYERIGYPNVIKSQWACNHHLYRRLDLPDLYDVSFVGQPHGNRRQVIESLRAAGVDVTVRGYGWEKGRVSQEEMIRIFNQSRINLNLANASQPAAPPHSRGPARLVRSGVGRALRTLPHGDRLVAAVRNSLDPRPGDAAGVSESPYPEQIKGRNFEVPGCGGFLLTGPADDLECFYRPGSEVAIFSDVGELVELVRYYLAHEDERRQIAEAGHARTIRDHTYTRRFDTIFESMGLPVRSPAKGPTSLS